jgi:arylsulfatase I/J
LLLVIDDWGWGNVGYHRKGISSGTDGSGSTPDDVLTPNFDELVRSGLELDRNYVHKFCSPTRSSIQSGRLPVHVNLVNADPQLSNPRDPVSGWAGIPRNMTTIAQLLKLGGYRTHMVGKWDCGMASPDHTPRGRGFDSSFGYFHHANDYWVEAIGSCPADSNDPESGKLISVTDLWMADDGGDEHGASNGGNFGSCVFCNGSAPPGIAPGEYKPMYNSASLLGVNGSVEDYEEWKFLQYALGVIHNHSNETAANPMFLNYNMHVAHEPLQAPHVYFQAQAALTNATYPDAPKNPRAIYHSMVRFADDCLGNLSAALKFNNMWKDSLVIVTSDNGGPMYSNNAANNFPLLGYKFTSFEGGIRVIGAVGGGFLDTANGGGCIGCRRRLGSRLEGIVHGTDWWATLAALAGVAAVDPRAQLAGLPAPDSQNLWPYLSGIVDESPRMSFQVDDRCIVSAPYKLMLGKQKGACHSGPHVPNASGNATCTTVMDCGQAGCLFDIFADPQERVDLASLSTHQATLRAMQTLLADANEKIFDPERGEIDPRACKQVRANGGYWGPFAR